jgi:hypothetical protein
VGNLGSKEAKTATVLLQLEKRTLCATAFYVFGFAASWGMTRQRPQKRPTAKE